jgi:cold shock protein
MPKPVCSGRLKFFMSDEGWGGIQSRDAPGDVWVHYPVIEGAGYKELVAGETVEFRYEEVAQDSWRFRTTWVPAPADAIRLT